MGAPSPALAKAVIDEIDSVLPMRRSAVGLESGSSLDNYKWSNEDNDVPLQIRRDIDSVTQKILRKYPRYE